MGVLRLGSSVWIAAAVIAWGAVTFAASGAGAEVLLAYFLLVPLTSILVSPAIGYMMAALCAAVVVLLQWSAPLTAAGTVLALAALSVLGGAVSKRREAQEADFAAVLRVAADISETLDPDRVLHAIVQQAAQSLDAKAASIRLVEADGETLAVRAVFGLTREYLNKGPVRLKHSPLDRRALNGEVVYVPDATRDPRFQYPEEARREGIVSVLCVPLQARDRVMGVLRVYAARRRRFRGREVRLLSGLATYASLALEHARWHQETLTFTRKVAHELKAPLAAVENALQVVLDGYTGANPEKQQEMLTRAERRTRSLVELVNDLLLLSRSRSAANGQPRTRVPLQEVIRRTVGLMEAQAATKQISLRLEVEPTAPPVSAVEEHLEEILSNVLSNAVKYTPPQGEVTVSLQVKQRDVQVVVQDTGIGIPPEDLGRVGQEFFRAANARAAEIPGTGLGLAIVRALAERYGGRLSVDSEPGRGTRVELTFPVARAA